MKFIAIATAILLAQPEVEAHGFIAIPQAQYKDVNTRTNYNARITASVNEAFKGKKWNSNPVANMKTFTAAFNSSSYASLKQMLDDAVPTCDNSLTDIPPVNVTDLKTMEWRNDDKHMGFIDTHHGPCEVWIDDTRVLQNDDCVAAFTTYPAVLPINYAACTKTNCILTIYWLALHEPDWQIYKQCVPITYPESLSIRTVKLADPSINTNASVAQPVNGSTVVNNGSTVVNNGSASVTATPLPSTGTTSRAATSTPGLALSFALVVTSIAFCASFV